MPERLLSHKIIIGVAIYNEGPYILQTLESLCNQTYTDFRVLISDNASTDGTGNICRDFCQKDHRFSYVCHSKSMEAYNSFNYINNVRTHPAIPAEQKAALTWFLIQVLQKRFQVFQPFDEMKHTYPEPAEIISNMIPCLETDK